MSQVKISLEDGLIIINVLCLFIFPPKRTTYIYPQIVHQAKRHKNDLIDGSINLFRWVEPHMNQKSDILMNEPECSTTVKAVWKVLLQRWLRLCEKYD